MGKANWIILALGLGACVVLSIFMRHALQAKQKASVDPVVRELVELFGPRLRGAPEFTISKDGERSVGLLTIKPRLAASSRNLAHLLGNFVWREHGDSGRIRSLVVIARGRQDEADLEFPIPRPLISQLPSRRTGAGKPRVKVWEIKPGAKPKRDARSKSGELPRPSTGK